MDFEVYCSVLPKNSIAHCMQINLLQLKQFQLNHEVLYNKTVWSLWAISEFFAV